MNNYTLEQNYYLYLFNQLLNLKNNNIYISEDLKKNIFNINFHKDFIENEKHLDLTLGLINKNMDILNINIINDKKNSDFFEYDNKTILDYFYTSQTRYLRKYKLNKIYENSLK